MNHRCDTCRYCQMSADHTGIDFECHRLPPTLFYTNKRIAGWPQVNSDDWCGEWEHTK